MITFVTVNVGKFHCGQLKAKTPITKLIVLGIGTGSQVASGHPFPVKLMYLSSVYMIIECGATMRYNINIIYQWLWLDSIRQVHSHPASTVNFVQGVLTMLKLRFQAKILSPKIILIITEKNLHCCVWYITLGGKLMGRLIQSQYHQLVNCRTLLQ